MTEERMVVFADYWAPGFRAGGPVASLTRIVAEHTGPTWVVTRNHDLGLKLPYLGVSRRDWNPRGRALIAYLRASAKDYWWIVRELRRLSPSLYYFNSLHSWLYSLAPLAAMRLRLLPASCVAIAPRGECSPGAQGHKSWKKSLGRQVIPIILPRDVVWHASSQQEAQDIGNWLHVDSAPARTVIRADPAPPPDEATSPGSDAGSTSLRIVFASRIHPIKGLDRAMSAVSAAAVPASLVIHGVVSDDRYWDQCQRLTRALEPAIDVSYHGPYGPDDIQTVLRSADLFVLPSAGENFGHAIAEALSVGCPVLITRKTPWHNFLQGEFGLATDDGDEMARYIASLAAMRPEDRQALRARVLATYTRWFEHERDKQGSLLDSLLDEASGVDSSAAARSRQ